MAIGVLNLGLKSIRFIIFDYDGRSLACESIPVTTWLDDKMVEQDANEWVVKADAVIRKATRSVPSGTIEAISISASASCLVYTDAKLEPLGRVIMVSDRRAQQEAAEIEATLAENTRPGDESPEVKPDQFVPKMLWLKRNTPDNWKHVHHVMGAGDFLGAYLTGHIVTDVVSATKFLYDPTTSCYPTQLFESLDIRERILPSVVYPGSKIGSIQKERAQRLELGDNVDYIVSSYDAICGSYGAGMREPGDAADMSGTVTSVRAIATEQPSGKGLYVTPGLQRHTWLVGGSNNLGGGLVEWAKGIALVDGDDSYDRMQAMAKGVGPLPGGLIFLPYLLGERAPLWDPTAKGAFLGLNRNHSTPDLIRAIFESTCFATRMLLETINGYGVDVQRVYAGGGLTRLDLVNQLKANIIGRPLTVSSQSEATSLGAAMVCASGMGVYDSLTQAVDEMALDGMTVNPEEAESARYSEGYELFKDAYRTLRPWFRRHAKFASKSWADNSDNVSIVNL